MSDDCGQAPVRGSDCYPGIRQAVRLLVLFLALQIAFGVAVGLVGGALNYPLHTEPAVIAAVNLAAAAVVLMRGFRRTKAPLAQVFPLARIRLGLLVPMACAIVGASILLSECDNLLRSILPVPSWVADFFSNLTGGETSLWGSVLALVVVAPITEEMLFRGLILRGFLGRYTAGKAVVVSSILFALAHLNPWQVPVAAVLGMLLAWWFVETRSLLPCLFGHALANALPILVARLLPVEIPGFTVGPSAAVEFQPLWFDLLGGVLFGCGLWLLVRMFRRGVRTSTGEPSAGP